MSATNGTNVRDHAKREMSVADVAQGPVPGVRASADEKARYVYARYSVQNSHYAGFYQTWSKTILFLLNKQWLRWMSSQRRYTSDTDVPPWRQQPVTNVTYAVYRTLAAKLTKQKPTLEVVPPSGDSDDREAAKLGEAILVHLWRLLRMPAKVRRAIGWYLCTGQVFLRVHWDPEAGRRMPRTTLVEVPHPEIEGETVDAECACDEDGKPYLGDDGAPDLEREPESMPEGEIAVTIEDPLSVRYDPEATDADDACEMFVARLWPRAKAAAHFKVPEMQFHVSDGDSGDREVYDDLLSGAAAGAGWLSEAAHSAGVGPSQQDALGDRVLVVEYYRKPDDERPDGAHWITVGQTKVWPAGNKEAPLPGGFWPPLVPVLSLPIPGQPQAIGPLSQVVPLNEQLNVLDGKIMEHEVTMAMGGKWVVHPEDKGIRITSDPAQVIASKGYAHDKPPVQADLKPLPAEIYAERAVIMDKIRMVMSLSEAELGRKPEGVSAGRAFLVLQEVTDSVLGPDLQAWEDALEEVGRRQLVLAQQHYQTPRAIQIRGTRGQWEVQNFTAADLTDGLDVRVQVGSSFPWSKSAQWDTKLNVLTTFKELVLKADGTLDQERLAHFLDTSGTGLQSFESDEDPDLVEIEREHEMFANYDPEQGRNELPQIAFWQVHPKHAQGHFDFMKRDRGRFEKWSKAAQAKFVAHMMQTIAAVEQLAGQLAGATSGGGAVPGAPGEPGAEPGADGADGAPASDGSLATMTANERPTLGAADYASADPAMAEA